MKSGPVEPAVVSFTDGGLPFSPAYGDIYHARGGALAQARHVFLAGSGLPSRWQGRDGFCIVETGFGLGNNFLATWDAWRNDALRCDRLHYVSLEKHPLRREDLARVHHGAPLAPLAGALIDAWPPATHNLHRIAFEGGRVQLSLCFGDAADWLPELVVGMDACFLDGFAPGRNPQMWQARMFKALARLALPGTTAATWSVSREVREGLAAAGFEIETAPGFDGKKGMTRARFAPRFVPRRAPARSQAAPAAPRHAVIVGAGLAGCATAWALSQQGWTSTLIERHSRPAMETSGNEAGMFHGTVNAPDGVHSRFNRAAALAAATFVRSACAAGHLREGGLTGALRLETAGTDAAAMRATLRELGLPPDYVEALDADRASRLSGLALASPAWFYPGGGWLVPGELARAFMAQAGDAVHFRAGVGVAALRHTGSGWQLLDAQERVIETAGVVVLAGGADSLKLLGDPGWPVRRVRGQTTTVAASLECAPRVRMPVAGAGYVLPECGGRVLFGATSQPDDEEPLLRRADHAFNLRQLRRITGSSLTVPAGELGGRVGWRLVANDRLPLIGAVPDAAALAQPGRRLDQPRFVPRMAGLYIFTALASRGITWASLGAQAVAALASGAPSPLEASLLDAVDVGRFASRQARRSG